IRTNSTPPRRCRVHYKDTCDLHGLRQSRGSHSADHESTGVGGCGSTEYLRSPVQKMFCPTQGLKETEIIMKTLHFILTVLLLLCSGCKKQPAQEQATGK